MLLTPNEDRDQVFSDGSRLIVRQGWMRPHVELIQPERFYDSEKLREYNSPLWMSTWAASSSWGTACTSDPRNGSGNLR